jgi:hypothetical protein
VAGGWKRLQNDGDEIKEDEMGGTCCMHGGTKNSYNILEKLKGIDHSEELSVDERIT